MKAMKMLKLSALLLFATGTFCSVLYLLFDSPRPYTRPYARQVYAAQNVWRIESEHGQGSASPIECRQLNSKWVVTFLTARHVAQRAKTEWTAFHGKQKLEGGSVITQHTSEDAALIVFISTTPIEILPIESRLPVFGEKVWAVGYPGINQVIITEGIISHLVLASASTYYGCSGGPVIDSKGRVIGIVVSVFSDYRGVVQHIMRFTPIVNLESWLTARNISH